MVCMYHLFYLFDISYNQIILYLGANLELFSSLRTGNRDMTTPTYTILNAHIRARNGTHR